MRPRNAVAPAGGFLPAARYAWIAQAVDCESDGRPRVSEKPRSVLRKRARNASARSPGFPEMPAARSAWIATAVSFESAATPRAHEKPPLRACDAVR